MLSWYEEVMDGAVEFRYRLIALDDDPVLLRGLKRMLDARGIQTSTYTDGHKALHVLRDPNANFDVMLCDISMPGLDGIEVVRQVRHTAPEVPVVMLTADRSAQTAVRALKAGAFNYLTKPPGDTEEVVETLIRAASLPKPALVPPLMSWPSRRRAVDSCSPTSRLTSSPAKPNMINSTSTGR